MPQPLSVGALIFEQFELLDLFGPLEMFGLLPEHFTISLVAEHKGIVASAQGPQSVASEGFGDSKNYDLILVPGGMGTRAEIKNQILLEWLALRSKDAEYVCSVCTGSALLAKAGILNGYRATSNKGAFNWVASQDNNVRSKGSGQFYEVQIPVDVLSAYLNMVKLT